MAWRRLRRGHASSRLGHNNNVVQEMRAQVAVRAGVLGRSCCASGRKKNGLIGLSRLYVEIAGVFSDADDFVLAGRSHVRLPKYFPIGSSFLKNLRANASLITATCREAAVSCSEMPRPLRIGFPMTSKYPGVTRSQAAKLSSWGPGAGCPSTHTPATPIIAALRRVQTDSHCRTPRGRRRGNHGSGCKAARAGQVGSRQAGDRFAR